MPLFDRYIMVDWSAANSPKMGPDSIWIADAQQIGQDPTPIAVTNIPTRHEAMQTIKVACTQALARAQRLFIGCDFSFGYPAGTASVLTGRPHWHALWAEIQTGIIDTADNRSNRFEYAARLNQRIVSSLGGEGPFWGHPPGRQYNGLAPHKPAYTKLEERREVERLIPGAHPTWKLAYAGAVGSQALLGIAHFTRLRATLLNHMAIWPFETGFARDLSRPIILAETYPALFDVIRQDGEVRDAAQVRCVVKALIAADKKGELEALFQGPDTIGGLDHTGNADTTSKALYTSILREEGWMMGALCAL